MALCVGAVLKGSPLRTMGDILSLYMWHGFATGDFATKHFTGFPQRAALWPAPTATSVMSRRPASRILKKSLTIPLHSSILDELSGQGPDAAGSLNLKKFKLILDKLF